MNRTLTRTALVLASASALAASLAGCSSSGGASAASSKTAHAAINAAATKSIQQGSAQVAMTTEQTIGTTKTTTNAGGVVAFDGSLGRLLLVLPQAKARVEEMVVDNTVYLRMASPSFPAAIQNKWIKTNLNDVKTLKSLGFSGLPPVSNILSQLTTIGGTAVDQGKVSVGNKTYTKYVVTVSRDELVKKAEQYYGKTSSSVTALKAAPATTHATVSVFVSKDGLVAREIETMSIPVSGKNATTSTDIALVNYRTPIDKTLPKAKSYIDGPSLFVKK
jgi:hypothetical protein